MIETRYGRARPPVCGQQSSRMTRDLLQICSGGSRAVIIRMATSVDALHWWMVAKTLPSASA